MAGETKKTTNKTPAAVPAVDKAVTHLVVQAKRDGFRRAGRAWPAEQTVVPIDEFTEDQVHELLAEPQLVVVPSAVDPTEKK